MQAHSDALTRSFVPVQVGNPTAFAVNGNNQSKLVLVYVLHTAKCQADCGIGNGVSTSTDDGLTWATKDVSKEWGAAAGSLPGPGNGAETTSGRLLVAAHHSAYIHDFVVYSDDQGESWAPIPQMFPKFVSALPASVGILTVLIASHFIAFYHVSMSILPLNNWSLLSGWTRRP